jgi:pimeloyl-ACP methyl ester carboxylesterase
MDFAVKEEKGFKYIEQGKGEVLLLLHGLMGALSNWEHVIKEFSKEYRVIIPMLPIYEMPLLTIGVKSLAKYVHKFVKFKELEDVVVLGNSLGGHVALIYSMTHPEKLKSMVLAGSSGLYENAFGGSFPRRESYEFIKGKVEYTFYDPKTATKELVDEVYASVNDRHKIIRLLAMAKSAIRHNMANELHKINIPVALIWGKNDKITPPEVAVEFSHLLPHAELTWVEHCGHVPMMEHPAEFNRLLKIFLTKNKV